MNKAFIFFIFLSFSFSSCFHHGNQSRKDKKMNSDTSLVDAFHLLGKHIYSLDSVLSDEDKPLKLVFLFNYYDCASCIDSGFQLVKRIDRSHGDKMVAVISTMGSPTSYQTHNQYYEYVYSDNKDLIRKELKYVQTPILFLVNEEKKVLDYIFPNVSDEQEYVHFFDLLKKTGY